MHNPSSCFFSPLSPAAAAHQVISDFALDLLKLETGNRLFLPIMKRQWLFSVLINICITFPQFQSFKLSKFACFISCAFHRYVDFAAILDAAALPQSVDWTLQSSFYKVLQVNASHLHTHTHDKTLHKPTATKNNLAYILTYGFLQGFTATNVWNSMSSQQHAQQ